MWSVCWDSGEGQRGLTRGGPVSPNCHREHGQRGSVSTVINHAPSLSLSLSCSLPLFLFSHSPIHTVFLLPPSLTLPHPLSIPVLLSAFVFPLTSFLFFYPPHPFSLRNVLFHLGYWLPFHRQRRRARLPASPLPRFPLSLSHTLTFTACLFLHSLICFTSAFLRSYCRLLVRRVFYTRPLD